MAKNKGDKSRKAEAGTGTETGGAAQNIGAGAEAGADYDAAYKLALAGRIAEAEAVCRKILTSHPSHAEALQLLGGIAAKSGNAPSAIELFTRALEARPDFAKAHSNLGALLLGRGEAEAAVDHFEKAIASEPDFAPAYTNLGTALMKSGRFADAATAFERAVQLEPDNALGYNNLGAVLLRQGREDEAIARFKKAIKLEPDLAMAHNNLGNALMQNGDLEGAAASFRRALELGPDLAEVHTNLGLVYRAMGRVDEALASHEKALELNPGFYQAEFHRGLLFLAQGEFERGWAGYLARTKTRARTDELNLYRQPLPEDLTDSHIFLPKDQGLGDEIFFLRFAPELKNRGARITYQAEAKIASIVKRLPFIDAVVGEDAARETADMNISVGDLPYLLGMKSAADIPPSVVLSPLPERVEAIAAKLAAFGPAPYIGVTWRAGVRNRLETVFKVAPVEELGQVLGGVCGTFLALQRKPEAGEIEAFGEKIGRPLHDLTAPNEALEDMLALLSLMDEYVTVSNTNVHLRAGTGRTSRVLVPNPPQYRWMAEGTESPWFPGCKVYRQMVKGSWDEALAALAEDLAKAFGARSRRAAR